MRQNIACQFVSMSTVTVNREHIKAPILTKFILQPSTE